MTMAAATNMLEADLGLFGDDERDPFAAYVMDEESRHAAADLAGRRGWPTIDVRRGGLAAAVRTLGNGAPPRYMVLDIADIPSEEAIEGLAEIARSGAAIIALGSENDVTLYRRLREVGVRDYLIKPVSGDQLNEAFARIEAPDPGRSRSGRVVAFVGARGGVGTTTLATNSAWLMAERLHRRTALVDLDLHTGNVALSLDIEPTRGLREAAEDPERIDEVFLQNAMAHIDKYLHVLATEESFDDGPQVPSGHLRDMVDAVRGAFDVVLLDLPRHVAIGEPGLLGLLDDIVIVLEPSLYSLREGNRLVRHMRARHMSVKLHLIVNRAPRKPELDRREVERGIDHTVEHWLPLDEDVLMRSEMLGQPLAKAKPRHAIVSALHRLNVVLAGVPDGARKPLWRRLLRAA